MKFHGIAEDILSSKIKIAVLRLLVRYPSKKYSGRELARLLNSSPSSVLEALELLRHYGLAHKTRIGKTTEWIINKRHLLIAKLSPLLKLDEEFLSVLCRKIKSAFLKNKNVVRVVLFGSIVKGKEHPDSDIDLFILVKENKHKKQAAFIVNKLNDSLIPLFGNSVSAIIYSSKELKGKKELSLVKHIEEEGEKIFNRG